jgi:glycosyltransferase involved in cell wall biosynthesis
VHLNGYAHGALPWRAPVIVVGHSCVSSWSEAVGVPIDRPRLDRYRGAVTAGIQAASRVIAPTAAMLHALRHHYGPLPSPDVIHNGVDSRRFHAGAKEPFVLTGGRLWDPAKNIDAVAAVARLLSWPVVAAGEADATGVPSALQHAGRLTRKELAKWMARASIFTLPARYEPFGLLPLEAALSGCALVLGDIPSLREVWGDAAVFVDPDDRDHLKRALERLIGDERLRRRYAERARGRALAYSSEQMATGYLRAHREAVSGELARVS